MATLFNQEINRMLPRDQMMWYGVYRHLKKKKGYGDSLESLERVIQRYPGDLVLFLLYIRHRVHPKLQEVPGDVDMRHDNREGEMSQDNDVFSIDSNVDRTKYDEVLEEVDEKFQEYLSLNQDPLALIHYLMFIHRTRGWEAAYDIISDMYEGDSELLLSSEPYIAMVVNILAKECTTDVTNSNDAVNIEFIKRMDFLIEEVLQKGIRKLRSSLRSISSATYCFALTRVTDSKHEHVTDVHMLNHDIDILNHLVNLSSVLILRKSQMDRDLAYDEILRIQSLIEEINVACISSQCYSHRIEDFRRIVNSLMRDLLLKPTVRRLIPMSSEMGDKKVSLLPKIEKYLEFSRIRRLHQYAATGSIDPSAMLLGFRKNPEHKQANVTRVQSSLVGVSSLPWNNATPHGNTTINSKGTSSFNNNAPMTVGVAGWTSSEQYEILSRRPISFTDGDPPIEEIIRMFSIISPSSQYSNGIPSLRPKYWIPKTDLVENFPQKLTTTECSEEANALSLFMHQVKEMTETERSKHLRRYREMKKLLREIEIGGGVEVKIGYRGALTLEGVDDLHHVYRPDVTKMIPLNSYLSLRSDKKFESGPNTPPSLELLGMCLPSNPILTIRSRSISEETESLLRAIDDVEVSMGRLYNNCVNRSFYVSRENALLLLLRTFSDVDTLTRERSCQRLARREETGKEEPTMKEEGNHSQMKNEKTKNEQINDNLMREEYNQTGTVKPEVSVKRELNI